MSVASLKLSQCITGMVYEKRASGASQHTIDDYLVCLKKLQLYLKSDPALTSITRETLVAFFAWLRDEYTSTPGGAVSRGTIRLSEKTRLNVHIALSALWTWAVETGVTSTNLVRTIQAPSIKPPVIVPFSKEEIEALLSACDRSAAWNGGTASKVRPTADRDRAIVLLLLDSGMRASELCEAKVKDVSLGSNSIKVLGKGNKERVVYYGKRTAKALMRYLLPRLEEAGEDEPLFLVDYPADPRPLDRKVLLHLLKRIGERAGVRDVHPHRFRHTFGITYLRNSGDVFTLQTLLGHSDLKTSRVYASIAQQDCARVHQTASPVDNWRVG